MITTTQSYVDAMKKEFETREAALEAQIAEHRERKWAQAGLDSLQEQLDKLRFAHRPAIRAAEERVKAAKQEEAAKAAAVTQRLQEKEDALKAQAQNRWIMNGGNADDFALVWPELHKRLLVDATLADLTEDRNIKIRL